jgi:hypothetical protein
VCFGKIGPKYWFCRIRHLGLIIQDITCVFGKIGPIIGFEGSGT